jgi:beta-N-acetylhexosaminidase
MPARNEPQRSATGGKGLIMRDNGSRAPVAQWIERSRPKAGVGGSNPSGGAIPHRSPRARWRTSLLRSPTIRRFTVVVLFAIIGGCATATPPSASPSIPAATASPSSATPNPTPLATPVPTATPTCAATTLAALTESQRIGQLFNVGLAKDQLAATARAAVAKYHFGSMWFTARSAAGVAAIRAVADAVQAQATTTITGGVGFFVAANQEGGLIQALSGPGFDTIPSALDQGTLTPAVLEEKAARWGSQLAAAGINLNFAPVADVVPPGTDAQNAPIGQLKREYGHDPATVAAHVAAFVAGMEEAGIATSAKHFPGLGRVVGNTDFTAEVIDSVTTRDDPYLEPFATAVGSGVPFVMVALATYEVIDPTHLAAFSPTVIGGMLRNGLGFGGVVISDDLGATAAVASIPPGTRAMDFVAAGGDMIIARDLPSATAMATALAAHVEEDATFGGRVDDAVLHVLDAKEAAGLVTCDG